MISACKQIKLYLSAAVISLTLSMVSYAHEPTHLHCSDVRNSDWWLRILVHVAEPNDKYVTGISWIKDNGTKVQSGENFTVSTEFYRAEYNIPPILRHELTINRITGEATLWTNGYPVKYRCVLQQPKF